jgi:hypothetical protein
MFGRAALGVLFAFLVLESALLAQNNTQTMRPVIRGRHAAITSMKAEATEAARRILDAGGNAFDAAVAGQAALAVTDFSLNGVGSDAVLLVYDSREKKVYSINAEPRAPRLATIEWYEKNNGGKIPESDGLLSGGIPGVVDTWYILLDRWGTMNFEQVLQPAIDLAENGFPLSELGPWSPARPMIDISESKKILKYPTTVKIYLPDGHPPKAGEILKNPDLARTLKLRSRRSRDNRLQEHRDLDSTILRPCNQLHWTVGRRAESLTSLRNSALLSLSKSRPKALILLHKPLLRLRASDTDNLSGVHSVAPIPNTPEIAQQINERQP